MVGITDKKVQNNVREKYSNAISQLLLGPGSEKINNDVEHEIISEKPQTRYVTGILYPFNELKKALDEDIETTLEAQEFLDKEEESTEIDNSFLPSSLGITFYCKSNKKDLNIEVLSSYYKKVKNPFLQTNKEVLEELKEKIIISKVVNIEKLFEIDKESSKIKYDEGFEDRDETISDFLNELKPKEKIKDTELLFLLKKIKNINYGNKRCFERVPVSFEVRIDSSEERISTQELLVKEEKTFQIFSKVQKINLINNETVTSITVVLKNISENHFFQTEIIIKSQENVEFKASEDVKLPDLSKLNSEDAMNFFLYRDKRTYAFGRGVSATWKENNGKISEIKTSYIPTYELRPMSFDVDDISSDVLSAESYIGNDHEIQVEKLNQFVEAYDKWIDSITQKSKLLVSEYTELSKENIEKCRNCSHRMKKTIKFLANDKEAFMAFNKANEAMLLQRLKNSIEKEEAYSSKNYQNANFKWRPFQLAFVLNSLESILNEESSEREMLDLIWVSTGGGKTEAYLFAIAAVVVYRRLKYENCSGVTVIMRYTLRLLTAQQFDRASQLICALEFIRRREDFLGDLEISIGLWIGEGTKNKLKDAKSDFKDMVEQKSLEAAKKKNTFQVLECPWCHQQHSIVPDEKNFQSKRKWGYYEIEKKNGFNMKCLNKNCEFSKGLPIYVVDELIYEKRPTLLFGTVDKFAQVPLKEETANLFGSDKPEKYRRPELIIQDELHLISGPLGSIVGLYEAGFDYILKNANNSVAPKYIASTATIRNAADQVKGIFDRKVSQFPPSGIEISDNFFVKEDTKSYGRQYLGIMATGKSQITAEIRLLSSMLQTVTELGLNIDEEELYWTVAGYFNSIRELGKASGLIKDDVKEHINQLYRRNNTNKRFMNDDTGVELTARVPGIEIPTILKKLDVPHNRSPEEIQNGEKYSRTVDTLIATNMLSVGVDINRLNTMFVVGQPKLTSEYIQATSRVGRQSLGLVCTLYNSSRSRDRSHYETFQSYHESLYKFVESSSVTPFSVPALKKAVAGVIVSMLRNTIEILSGDNSARNILEFEDELEKVKDYLLARVRASEDRHHLYREDANKIINKVVDKWCDIAEEMEENDEMFKYYLYKSMTEDFQGKLLLRSFDDRSTHQEATKVMGTMRNVEDTAYLRIID
ncbi:helicase-related protein [Carnobacterium divergens]|uniref:helicase-related protein n=1 Tax=Carnobacterium divergens TaxID=2748 RepID=UPI0039B0CA6A